VLEPGPALDVAEVAREFDVVVAPEVAMKLVCV
jgi:hypothetical protein